VGPARAGEYQASRSDMHTHNVQDPRFQWRPRAVAPSDMHTYKIDDFSGCPGPLRQATCTRIRSTISADAPGRCVALAHKRLPVPAARPQEASAAPAHLVQHVRLLGVDDALRRVQAVRARRLLHHHSATGWLGEARLARPIERVEHFARHARGGEAAQRRLEAALVGLVLKRRGRVVGLSPAAELALACPGAVLEGGALRVGTAGGGDLLPRAAVSVQRVGARESIARRRSLAHWCRVAGGRRCGGRRPRRR